MNRFPSIATDLVLSPFGASATELVEAAKCADESGFFASVPRHQSVTMSGTFVPNYSIVALLHR